MYYDTNAYANESQTKSQMKMKKGGKILGYDTYNVWSIWKAKNVTMYSNSFKVVT